MGLVTPRSVWKLQHSLHVKAKGKATFRFYSLYDKLYREDILRFAWRDCRSRRGNLRQHRTGRGSRMVATTGGRWTATAGIGYASGWARSTNAKERARNSIQMNICMIRSAWSVWSQQHATSRGRRHENTLVRKPDAGKPHVRFDERESGNGDMEGYSGTGNRKGRSQLWPPLRPPRHLPTLHRLPKGGVFVVFVQSVMNFFWCFENRTESDDAHMPLGRLKSTSANSCVPARKPLGYVGYYAPAPVSGLRLALHHFSTF